MPYMSATDASGNFNPRSREGSDSVIDYFNIKRLDFNPRSREGSDQNVCSFLYILHFNPRSREGSDFKISSIISPTFHFNPRSREGSDGTIPADAKVNVKFQSTLPRGERLDTNLFMGSGGGISIHAPARGATILLH